MKGQLPERDAPKGRAEDIRARKKSASDEHRERESGRTRRDAGQDNEGVEERGVRKGGHHVGTTRRERAPTGKRIHTVKYVSS